MFLSALAILYYLSFSLLAGLAAYVLLFRPRARRNHLFFSLALCLLLWKATLFWETRTDSPAAWLWLGRANFAVMVPCAFLARAFVRDVAGARDRSVWPGLLRISMTVILACLSLFTPLVSSSERVEEGRAITEYGPLAGVLVCPPKSVPRAT